MTENKGVYNGGKVNYFEMAFWAKNAIICLHNIPKYSELQHLGVFIPHEFGITF